MHCLTTLFYTILYTVRSVLAHRQTQVKEEEEEEKKKKA
jgi:hypothetical protein